ncbi:unnamed protein product [Prorocentrum cordatum]|uniref:Uncharacterized protein n=1 Tax=Prorocentrum cordatum TaxID=2364126 RepID=A0ABN9XCF1_9DINO|nr:unnamed protein product [Polarella glacialis]
MHPAGGSECFISTVMLDGETSLKERNAPSVFEAFSRECGNKSSNWMTMQQAEEETAGFDHAPTLDIAEIEHGASTRNWGELEPEIHRYLNMISKVGVSLKLASPTPTLQDGRARWYPHA